MSTPIQNKSDMPSIKTITFRRNAVKRFYENYDLTFKVFSAKLRKDGWDGKVIKDEGLIKKLWDELVADNSYGGGAYATIDVDADNEFDGDDEDWEDDDAEDNVWEHIFNEPYKCLPVCSTESCNMDVLNEGELCEKCEEEKNKTPEQKEKEAEQKAKAKEEAERMWEKRKAIAKKDEEEYRIKMDIHLTGFNVEGIKKAVVKAEEFFKPKLAGELPPILSREATERMRNSRRCEILAEMSKLVAELEEVAKW